MSTTSLQVKKTEFHPIWIRLSSPGNIFDIPGAHRSETLTNAAREGRAEFDKSDRIEIQNIATHYFSSKFVSLGVRVRYAEFFMPIAIGFETG
jgi:hypothetical protein